MRVDLQSVGVCRRGWREAPSAWSHKHSVFCVQPEGSEKERADKVSKSERSEAVTQEHEVKKTACQGCCRGLSVSARAVGRAHTGWLVHRLKSPAYSMRNLTAPDGSNVTSGSQLQGMEICKSLTFFFSLWLIMSEFFCVLMSVNVTRARACSLTLSAFYFIPPAVLSGCQLLSAASCALCFRKCLISALRRLRNLSLNASGTQTQQTVFFYLFYSSLEQMSPAFRTL